MEAIRHKFADEVLCPLAFYPGDSLNAARGLRSYSEFAQRRRYFESRRAFRRRAHSVEKPRPEYMAAPKLVLLILALELRNLVPTIYFLRFLSHNSASSVSPLLAVVGIPEGDRPEPSSPTSINDEEDSTPAARPDPRFPPLTFRIVRPGGHALEIFQRLLDFFPTDTVTDELAEVPIIPVELDPQYAR